MQTSCSIAGEKGLGQPGNENLDSVSCLTGARKEDRSEGELSLHDDSEPWKSTLCQFASNLGSFTHPSLYSSH